MICKKCKKEIDDDSKFCIYCGEKFINKQTKKPKEKKGKELSKKMYSVKGEDDNQVVDEKLIKAFINCRSCEKQIPKNSKFCPFCGEKIITKCFKCGADLIEYAQFCNICGIKFFESFVQPLKDNEC